MSVTLEASPGIQQMPSDASRMASHPACGVSPELPCEVATFVANLPSQQRAALMLRRFHQRGYADIAATLGCTEHEARATVHEALRSLRIHLSDRI
jgi:DNA-directed RNA polymerase specialized sigma24 family protein